MKKDLPIYDIVLSDESQGVGFISLVDVPAIGVDWIKLSKQSSLSFKANKDKQLLYGPFLIPNMLIYRFDDKMGEYYVRFSKEEIEKIATKFNEDLNNKNINFMHTDEKVAAFVAQNWVIDGEQDKSKNLGFDLPEGTWFGGVKIKEESFWTDKVKSDEVKGFSVEILADLELSLKNKESKMEKQIKLGSAMLEDGETTVYWEGDTLSPDAAVFIDEAMTKPAPDGVHMLQTGEVIRVAGGKVTVMAPALEMATLAAYPWDECIKDQMKQYDDEEIAKKVCGKIKAENMADATTAPETVANTTNPLSAEEVSAMIDARFADLMDEISKLKSLVGEKDDQMAKYKKEIEEKFSVTPATQSIKKNEVKIDDKFSKIENRIREFARTK